jgi:hypothetical protein
MDETRISTVQDPASILAPKGQKGVDSATNWEEGKNITVLCTIENSGFILPIFIFPYQRMSFLLEKDGPPCAVHQCQKSGWTNEDFFAVWLTLRRI